jgi:hypothetical protein
LDSNYYYEESSGILIRLEHEWHMIHYADEKDWEHWRIEKNLVSIDNQSIAYTYDPPAAYGDLSWLWIGLAISVPIPVVAVVVLKVMDKKKR